MRKSNMIYIINNSLKKQKKPASRDEKDFNVLFFDYFF